MSLSESQTRILRDMASGAEIHYHNGYMSFMPSAVFVGGAEIEEHDFRHLKAAGLITFTMGRVGDFSVYAITPAGAAAAGEGAE